VPPVAWSSPDSTRATVDLPEPDAPTSAVISPRRNCSETPSTALTVSAPPLIRRCTEKCRARSRVSRTTSLLIDELPVVEVAGGDARTGAAVGRGGGQARPDLVTGLEDVAA